MGSYMEEYTMVVKIYNIKKSSKIISAWALELFL